MSWALADAKNRFSELCDKALRDGPQTVSRRGKEEVVVVAAAAFARLRGERHRFVDFLVGGAPLDGIGIDRDRSPPREVEPRGCCSVAMSSRNSTNPTATRPFRRRYGLSTRTILSSAC